MPAASQQPVIWTVALATLVLLVGGFWAVGNIKNAIPEPVDIEFPEINIPEVPTAEEIASKIVVRDSLGGRNSNANLDEILEGVYPDKVRELERECVRDLQDEFDDDDVLDDIQDLIEDEEGEEIDDLEILDFNYNNDYDFDVINLGLDDQEDKEAEIRSTLRVQYVLEDGDQEVQKDKVYAFATCSDYDDEDNEFDELTVEYSLSDIF